MDGSQAPAVRRLKAMFETYVERFGAVGVMAGISLPGLPRIHVTAGVRDADTRQALSHRDLYFIGSQTKTFVAIAMLQLANDGVLSLDDSAATFIDASIDPRITIKHLIMNSSGLADYFNAESYKHLHEPTPPADVLAWSTRYPLLFEPGDRFDYSNTGWLIAAMIMDAVAPGGYAGFLKTRIFGPMGLEETFVDGGEPRARLCKGYGVPSEALGRLDGWDAFHRSWAYGAGDIVSSLDDMLTFYRVLAQQTNDVGVTLKDLTREIIASGAQPAHPLSLGIDYGYGVERRTWGGVETWGHPGRTLGYSAGTWISPATGAIVTTAFMNTYDAVERADLQAMRYNAPLIFTQAMMTALALQDQRVEAA